MYDVIVIGAGPAGLAAAATTARHHLKTLMIAPDLGGKAAYRMRMPWLQAREVIIGEGTVEQLREQVVASTQIRRYHDVTVQLFRHNDAFHVISEDGGVFDAPSVIVASGVTAQPLGVPGEQRLMGYGVSYSATSHAPLFTMRRVVVVGANLRALQSAAELSQIAAHVYLIAPDGAALVGYEAGRRLLNHSRVSVLAQHAVVEIAGEAHVSQVIIKGPDGSTQALATDGVFIELGVQAHTEFVGHLAERTPYGQIVVNERCASSCDGLFAAGDVTSSSYAEQIGIAIGEGMKAGLSASLYLAETSRERVVGA